MLTAVPNAAMFFIQVDSQWTERDWVKKAELAVKTVDQYIWVSPSLVNKACSHL